MRETTNPWDLGMADNGRFSVPAVLRELQQGETWLYAILTREGAIKIGITTDLATRKRGIKFGGTKKILGFRPGDLRMERDLHMILAPHAIYGTREYYYPVPDVLAKVSWMREHYGLKPMNRHWVPRLAKCTFHRRIMDQQVADARA